MAAGEGGGGHESAVEDVTLLDLVVVEEDGERGAVEERDNSRVRGDEGAGRHVGSEDSGVVFFYSGGEEGVTALVVEVVVAVADRAEEGEAVAAWDRFQWELLLLGV